MGYPFTLEKIEQGLSFEDYLKETNLRISLLNQNNPYQEYTKLNLVRMNRILKTIEISKDFVRVLNQIHEKVYWLLISEPWCGDAANSVPIIAKAALKNPTITLRIFLRDSNPEIMEQYLTNNAKSIPILVMLDENLNEVFRWGPRPKELQKLVMNMKNSNQFSKEEIIKKTQLWYAEDKSKSIQDELTNLLSTFITSKTTSS
ncbi:MAG: thioredoxin family protein [Ignavibacteria bacterium]